MCIMGTPAVPSSTRIIVAPVTMTTTNPDTGEATAVPSTLILYTNDLLQ